jgi:hypothetical protein
VPMQDCHILLGRPWQFDTDFDVNPLGSIPDLSMRGVG